MASESAQLVQAVLVSTAERTLAPGVELNKCWLKVTVISMVTAMEKPAKHSDEFATRNAQLNWLNSKDDGLNGSGALPSPSSLREQIQALLQKGSCRINPPRACCLDRSF
jgi:hypothetical protein